MQALVNNGLFDGAHVANQSRKKPKTNNMLIKEWIENNELAPMLLELQEQNNANKNARGSQVLSLVSQVAGERRKPNLKFLRTLSGVSKQLSNVSHPAEPVRRVTMQRAVDKDGRMYNLRQTYFKNPKTGELQVETEAIQPVSQTYNQLSRKIHRTATGRERAPLHNGTVFEYKGPNNLTPGMLQQPMWKNVRHMLTSKPVNPQHLNRVPVLSGYISNLRKTGKVAEKLTPINGRAGAKKTYINMTQRVR